jgi:protease I
MDKKLDGVKVAILVAEGFEQSELEGPRKALDEAGAKTLIVSPAKGKVRGWKHYDKGDEFPVDVALDDANASDFDALLLPGFADEDKPIAAICHGPWTLIEAGAVKGRTVTSWPSIQTDLKNAGAKWVDKEVVVDRGLVTSRKPDDIPAFNAKMVEEISRCSARRPAA